MMKLKKNGITIKDLKKFINNIPETEFVLGIEEDNIVWVSTGKGVSSPCTEISTLSGNNILLSP